MKLNAKTGAAEAGVAVDSPWATLTDVAVGDDRVWAVGTLDEQLDVGFATLATDDTDGLVLLFDAALEPQWGHRYGGLGSDAITAVTLAGTGATIVGSVATSFIENVTPPQPGPSHVFVSRLEP